MATGTAASSVSLQETPVSFWNRRVRHSMRRGQAEGVEHECTELGRNLPGTVFPVHARRHAELRLDRLHDPSQPWGCLCAIEHKASWRDFKGGPSS
jgi:hypothetical protein